MRARAAVLTLLLCWVMTAGCGDDRPAVPDIEVPATVTLTSAAFADGGELPVRFTCDGVGAWPPLGWRGGDRTASAWALVVDDPDAPGGTFVHWVLLDIPPATRSVAPGTTPAGSVQADNSTGGVGYMPPCPPDGRHHYRFTVYGLEAPTGLADGASLDRALEAIRSAAVERGRLVGTYER